jgi:hypothetical protein
MNVPHPPAPEQLTAPPSAQPDAAPLPAGHAAGASTVKPAADVLPLRAIRNANGTMTLPLAFPRTVRGQRFTELTFHRFTGADLNALAATSLRARAGVALARAMKIQAPVGKALFGQLDATDANDAGTIMHAFCAGRGPQ